MKAFTRLFYELDATTRTSVKVSVMAEYFRTAPSEDASWALYFLSGMRGERYVSARKLREWAAEESGLPEWLVEECHEAVGDLAETISRILPRAESVSNYSLAGWVSTYLLPLRGSEERAQRERVLQAWRESTPEMRFVGNKFITGGFRVGVARALLIRALSEVSGIAGPVLSHRLMGGWNPSAEHFRGLMDAAPDKASPSQPYPFCLAHSLDQDFSQLGSPEEWLVEWKWDGIRAQLIRRGGETYLWSRGEELISDSFPELMAMGALLPEGTVMDGEIVSWDRERDRPAAFHDLQRRLGRSGPSVAFQRKHPVKMIWFDLLERAGVDIRGEPLAVRRAWLAELYQEWLGVRMNVRAVKGWEQPEFEFGTSSGVKKEPGMEMPGMRLSAELPLVQWQDAVGWRNQARGHQAEGVMLKRRDSAYGVGRMRGVWWKWKVDPYVVDAVLIGAQPGHGRRATLFTDYTFGVWSEGKLVPVAKAYSGLTEEEIRKVDAFVRTHEVGRFGPVRAVVAELVFELAFEGIGESTRHKSGVALRFPRIQRWREDKKAADADTLEGLKALIKARLGQ